MFQFVFFDTIINDVLIILKEKELQKKSRPKLFKPRTGNVGYSILLLLYRLFFEVAEKLFKYIFPVIKISFDLVCSFFVELRFAVVVPIAIDPALQTIFGNNLAFLLFISITRFNMCGYKKTICSVFIISTFKKEGFFSKKNIVNMSVFFFSVIYCPV